jgi:hypothetical protein
MEAFAPSGTPMALDCAKPLPKNALPGTGDD